MSHEESVPQERGPDSHPHFALEEPRPLSPRPRGFDTPQVLRRERHLKQIIQHVANQTLRRLARLPITFQPQPCVALAGARRTRPLRRMIVRACGGERAHPAPSIAPRPKYPVPSPSAHSAQVFTQPKRSLSPSVHPRRSSGAIPMYSTKYRSAEKYCAASADPLKKFILSVFPREKFNHSYV
jgi:hypothetical protein